MSFPAKPEQGSVFRAALLVAAVLALPAVVQAQSWPTRPMRYIVNFAPGGSSDIVGRIVARGLSASLGQQVIVDNRPGQGGSIGVAELARAAPDGHTIGTGNVSSHAINVSLYSKLPYDPLKDFAPITLLVTLPNMLVVHPSLPARTVKELIAVGRARPNQLNFGSAGNGTTPHISGELFKTMTGVQMQHIPYKGAGPMMPDLLAGYVQLAFENITTAYPQVVAGKLRALAVTTTKRSFVAPEVPTMEEAGLVGYDINSWQALFAPAGTPREIVTRLHAEVVKVLRSPEAQKRFTELGLDTGGMTPEEVAALIRAEIPRLGKIVRESGARVD